MGNAQSAQRDAKKDAEPSGAGEDVRSEERSEDQPLENKEPISELNGKADVSLAGFIGHSEDAADGIPAPDKDSSNVEINANTIPEEEEVPVKMIEMEVKQNEINESFKRFFSNIGLKLTVRKGSAEKGEIKVPEEEPNIEDVKDTAQEIENAEQKKDLDVAQEPHDNDSTTGPTMTDGTSEDFLETETKKEAESNKADAAVPEEVVASPFKRFFKTGIFSGLRKKSKEPTEKELVDMGKKETSEAPEETVQDQQQDKAEVEDAKVWRELQDIKPEHHTMSEASAQTADEAKSPSTDPSAIIVTESEILSSQEKVQASPMKRLLSGSSLKKLSKKQRGRKLSDGKLSDSGEHSSDHLMSSTESADNPREDSSPQSSAEATGEDEGPWASFKKLLTPKKRMRPSSGHEEAQVPASADDAKPSEGEKISDHSSEEGRKRKDSSVSWEAVLCGSGRRRSRKTSDSEEESPQNDNADDKQDSGAKQGTETQLESPNEVQQAGSLPECDGGSTWKSFKKLVTPKRKVKDDDESKDYVHSDSEITHDDSSFSIKKLLPGRKKRRSGERQDQVSSDEAEKEAASGDEDSETPAVVPLSEFDTPETGVQIQTQADVESYSPKELEDKLEQDDKAEPVVPCDNQEIEAEKVQNKEEALKNEASTAPVTSEEADEELISKHQQLSDITEEGAITDTMATPASTNEEAARDDTIAEDLIEITSEAITAPEPVDVTLADETEMISAVSQLSESSKTSGNTTPVPAELDGKVTELLLQNVAENIQMSQEAVPTERPGLDIEATDAPHEPEVTTQTESASDTTEAMSMDIVSDVPTEEFDTAEVTADDAYKEDVSQLQDTISELEVTDDSQHPVECISEVNEAVSVETLPEGGEVLQDSAVGADEVEITKMDSQEAEPAAAEADGSKDGAVEQEIQILAEKKDQDIQNVPVQVPVEDQTPVVADKQEVLAPVETDELASEKANVKSLEEDVPFSEDISPAEKVTDEPKQTEEHLPGVSDVPENKEPQTEAPKIDQHEGTEVVQEAIVDSEEARVQSLEKEVPSEDVRQEETLPSPEVGVVQVAASKTEHIQEQEVSQAATLDSEVSSPVSHAKEVISEDVPPEETVGEETKEEPVPLAEDNVEPEDTPKSEHIQKKEALQVEQDITLDSEAGSPQILNKEVTSEDAASEETVRDKPKEEPVPLMEVNVESVDASKTEHIQEPDMLQAGDASKESEVLKAVQAATLDSEDGSPQLLEKAVISEDVPTEDTVREEPQVETVPLADVNVEPVDAPKTEHVQEPETLQAVTLDSKTSCTVLPEKEATSEDVPSEETVREEPKVETVHLTEVIVEPVDAPKTEHIQEPEVLHSELASKEPEAGSPQLLEKEVISEDVPTEETVREEPKVETVPLADVNVEPVDAPKTEHVQEPETLQAATLDSETSCTVLPEKEVTSEDVPSEETVREEPKEETVPLTEVNDEPVDAPKTEHIQEPEVLHSGDASKEPEAGSPQLHEKEVTSAVVPPEETVEEPKVEPVRLDDVNVEPVDAPKTKDIQEPETSLAATLDSEANSPESLKKEETSEDVPSEETVREEPRQETVPLTEVNVEPVDAPKTEHIQEPEVLPAGDASKEPEAGSPQLPEKEVTSAVVPPEETVREEPKVEPVPLTEVNDESVDAPKTEHVQEPETLQAATLDSETSCAVLPEKEVTSEDVSSEETVKNEPKQETVPLADVNVETVDASKTEPHITHPEESQMSQVTTLYSEESSPQLHETEVTSEDVPPEETVREEPKQDPVPSSESTVEPVDAPETEHIQELETLQAATLDSEEGRPESPKKEETPEDVPPEETVRDEPKQETVPLTDANVESVDASKTEHIQEPETLQAFTLDSEASSPELPQKDVISEDVPSEETVGDEPKQDTVPLAESTVEPVDAPKTEHIQELETLQAATLDSEEGTPESLKKEETPEDVPSEEAVREEPKEEPVPLAEINVVPVDAPKTEHIQEPEVLQAGDASKEPEVLQAIQAATLDSEANIPESLKNDEKPEDVSSEETVRDEPKQETVPLADVNVESVDAPKTEHIQEPETLQAATLDSETSSSELPQKEITPEDVSSEETVREEPKEETVPLAEVNVETVDASKTEPHITHPEESQMSQVTTLDSEDGSPQLAEKEVTSEDVPPEEIVREEPKQDTVPLAVSTVESVDAPKTEDIQEPETLQAATLDSEAGSPESPKKEETPEDVPSEETVREEPKHETVSLADANVESVDAPKTEYVQEPETSQASTLDSESGRHELPQKEVISEDVSSEETVRDEPKEETVPLAEGNVEPVDAPKTEHIQEPELLQAGDASKEPDVLQTATLDSDANSLESLQKEETPEDVSSEETIRDDLKQETVPLADVNVESVDAPKTENIQEPETLQTATLDSDANSLESLQKEETSEDVSSEETVREEPKQETVFLAEVNFEPVDAPKTDHTEEPQVSQAITLDSEDGSPQLPEKEVTSEDVPLEEIVREETKEEPVPLSESTVESVDASKTEQKPEVLQAATLDSEASCSVSLEKEVTSAETGKDEPKQETVPLAEVNVEPVDASKEPEVLQTVQGTTSDSEAGGPQLLEKKEISEDVQVETVTGEPKQASEVRVEQEEPPVEPDVSAPDVKEVETETETGSAAPSVEKSSAQETQIVFDNVSKPAGEDVIASVREETENKVVDQALETNNDQKTKSLPEGVEVELEKSTTEAAGELETSPAVNVPSVTEEASCVRITEETVLSKETPEPCADSVEASDEPTHEVQVNGVGDGRDRLANAEMKTAEVHHVVVTQVTTCNLKDEIPSVLVEKTSETREPLIDKMAGETELKEAIERAAPLVEDSVEVEDNHRIQVVDVDIKSLIEVVVREDREVTDICHETIDKVEVLSATSGTEDEIFNKEAKASVQEDVKNVKEDLPGRIPESMVISLEREIMKDALTEVVENASNQAKNQKPQVSEDPMQTSEIPGELDVSEYDRKEDLEETKAGDEGVKEVNENNVEAQQTTQIDTTSDTGVVAPEDTGITLSECNMESPSSLSLEVQPKAQESPSLCPSERLEPLKQTDVTEVVEAVESISATGKAESEKQITEPLVSLDSTEGTKIASQAAQLDVGSQAMETAEPVEEITSTETVTPNVQAAETIQPETQTETREVFLSQPALSEAKTEEPTVRQTQEENDEVWLDAEEEINNQIETDKVEEPQEKDEKAEHVQETQPETHKSEGTPESEGEQFATALEHLETVTTSDMTMDLN